MRLTTGYEHKKARIELIPLLDITLMLLVFFIYAVLSMSAHQNVRVALPVARGEPQERAVLSLVLDEQNRIWLDNRICAMPDCVREVAGRVREQGLAVVIRGDRRTELGIGIELLARLRNAGVPAVAFEVEKQKKEFE